MLKKGEEKLERVAEKEREGERKGEREQEIVGGKENLTHCRIERGEIIWGGFLEELSNTVKLSPACRNFHMR